MINSGRLNHNLSYNSSFSTKGILNMKDFFLFWFEHGLHIFVSNVNIFWIKFSYSNLLCLMVDNSLKNYIGELGISLFVQIISGCKFGKA